MKKVIMIEPEQWKVITDFIGSRVIPIQESLIGMNVVKAINTAKEADAEVKQSENKKT